MPSPAVAAALTTAELVATALTHAPALAAAPTVVSCARRATREGHDTD